MEPDAWLKTVYAAMKPGGIVGVIDHVAKPGGDTRETVEKLHRIDPAVVKADFERAGFVLDGSSDMLRNPADDHRCCVFDPKIRGKTDRFVYRFRKPQLSKGADDVAAPAGSRRRRLLGAGRAGPRAAGRGVAAQSLGDGMREPALQVSGLGRRAVAQRARR